MQPVPEPSQAEEPWEETPLNASEKVATGDPRWRSVFSPDRKRLMNGIPMAINLFAPWLLFCITFFLWSFKFHFRYGTRLPAVLLGLVCICLVPAYARYQAHKRGLDPTWFGYTFVMFCLAVVCGWRLGDWNYQANMWPYFKYESLESYPAVDVGNTLGVNVLDAGRVYFASTAKIDQSRSWHFKDGTLYCVAPIVSRNGMATETLDFWAVGTDCCSDSASDFRCGEYANANARSGLRLLDEGALQKYRLAVEQASQLFKMHATNPLFFVWTQDPVDDVFSYQTRGWRVAVLAGFVSFFVSTLGVVVASIRFAYIGRTPPIKDDSDDEDV
jgi:hypothetical protein